MKKVLRSLMVGFVLIFGFVSLFGQENKQDNPETTYKVYSYTIVGSNDSAGKNTLPNNVSKAFAEVKDNFSYSDYKVLATQFQLIKTGGSILYKSILKNSDFTSNSDAPIFAEWSYQRLGENVSEGSKQIGFRSFRFNMRVPVKTSTIGKDDKIGSVINYESVGLTSSNVNFPLGKPVVLASFPVEVSDKTLFFVVHLDEIN